MSVLLRRPHVVLGLTLMALVVTPTASRAGPLDTVSAIGGGGLCPICVSSLNVNAHSGPSGQNPSGTASVLLSNFAHVSGSVTCLSITGPDRGPGTPGSPTTAILNFRDTTFGLGIVTFELVDHGGNGADTFGTEFLVRAPNDCSPLGPNSPRATLTNGRAVVVDAPVLPASKDQCKDGGWQIFGVFENQGDCVSFIATGGKNPSG